MFDQGHWCGAALSSYRKVRSLHGLENIEAPSVGRCIPIASIVNSKICNPCSSKGKLNITFVYHILYACIYFSPCPSCLHYHELFHDAI